MNKIIIILTILTLILLVGCNGQDELASYKGIAPVPDKCAAFQNDVCALFDCMVDQCWCHELGPEGAVLHKVDTEITDEFTARMLVMDYLVIKSEEQGEQIGTYKSRAVKLNNVFYNIFMTDEQGNEEVYTVAVDGTIIKTICGV